MAERKAKEEKLRRLKNAKRQELEERMSQVRNVLGYEGEEGKHSLGAAEEEMILKLMEGDYDPEKFEQVMNAAYGEDYYQKEDEKWKNDQDVKGDLAVEEGDVLGDGDMYDDANEENEAYEDYGEEVDEAYDEEEIAKHWENEQYAEESGMEKKLKSKMMDELYKLDYEDIIGDMPTRFKYRSVEANNYGLSTEEILFARDSALKQFVSLKKMAPYRDEEESSTLDMYFILYLFSTNELHL
jgi:protein KRI1